jgi:FkbM family methyltransferase
VRGPFNAILGLVKKLILAALLVLILAGTLLHLVAPAKSSGVWQVLLRQSPHCSLRQAWTAPDELHEQIQVKDAFIAALQLGARDEGFERWDLSENAGLPPRQFWIPAGNRWTLPFNLAEQERDIYQTAGDWGIRKGDVVLDCGAHVGSFAHMALHQGASLVVAIELSPRNAECLRRNFRKEIEEGRVVVYPKGVWNREEVLELRQVEDNSAADTVVMEQNGAIVSETVPLTTIDAIVEELNLTRVDHIKMDIEGAEVPALQGAARTLRRWKPRLALAAYHKGDDPVTLPAAVRQAVPEYRSRCASCILDEAGLRPEVLLFAAD